MLLAYRTMKSRITGFSPFQLVYGRKAKLPIEVIIETQDKEYMTEEEALIRRTIEIVEKMPNQWIEAKERIKRIQERVRQLQKKPHERLKIGEKVLLSKDIIRNDMSAKLEEKWTGPFFIHDVLIANNYKLRTMEGKVLKNSVHGNRLKLYNERQLEPVIII